MPTKNSVFRFEDEILAQADALASHESRRAGNVTHGVSRAEAIRRAIRHAYQDALPQIEADRRAWDGLLALAGETIAKRVERDDDHATFEPDRETFVRENGAAALLVLRGDGIGEQTSDGGLWERLAVTAFIGDEPIDLPLRVGGSGVSAIADVNEPGSGTSVFLTDAEGVAHVYLGTLSRRRDEGRYADRRLYSLAADLGFEV